MSASGVRKIRIWCGVAHQGVSREDLGQRMFFLDLIAENGDVSVVWDGTTYEDAIQAAEAWERDGCTVIDDVT